MNTETREGSHGGYVGERSLGRGQLRVSFSQTFCLSQCSIALKRHHDHVNLYRSKAFIDACLQFRGLVYFHYGGKYGDNVGRHGVREVAGNSASRSAGSRKRETETGLGF